MMRQHRHKDWEGARVYPEGVSGKNASGTGVAAQRWDWNMTGEEAERLGWVSEPEVVGPRRSLEGLWFYFKESRPL